MVRVVVLVDDNVVSGKYKAVHGLSLYIEHENIYLLFDLDSNEKILQHNIENTDVNPELVDAAIISHAHASHVGGISLIGWYSPYLTVYIPYGSIQSLGKTAKAHGLKPVEVTDWINPWPNIYVSKPIHGPPWEHFLVIKTSRGLLVFSGCMHPGVNTVLDTITSYLNVHKIYAVIGGFHLANAPSKIVNDTVKTLIEKYDVEKIVPLHCSGKQFKELLQHDYPDRYVEAGAGSVIDF